MISTGPATASTTFWRWPALLRGATENAKSGADDNASVAEMEIVARRIVAADDTVSARNHAAHLLESYNALSVVPRRSFLVRLAGASDTDRHRLTDAARSYLNEGSDEATAALIEAAQSSNTSLFRRLVAVAGGALLLVRMRDDIQSELKNSRQLRSFDFDLRLFLRRFFDRDTLWFRQLDWNTSASLLELLMEREAVHPMRGWFDLRRRFRSDRRCFALFHPSMPDDPLIFVEVALFNGLPSSIAEILEETEAADGAPYDTAIFYSITNCHRGLQGIPFGEELLRHSIAAIRNEHSQIRRFATLSPVPGFRTWLDGRLQEGSDEASKLAAFLLPPKDALVDLHVLDEFSEPLLELCREYLFSTRPDGMPLDPVARFHLGNGAQLARINWNADTSERGVKQSLGLMVNYLYSDDTASQPSAFAKSRMLRTLASSAARRFGLRKQSPRERSEHG